MTNQTLFTHENWHALMRVFGPITRDTELPCANHPLGRVLVMGLTDTSRGGVLHWA